MNDEKAKLKTCSVATCITRVLAKGLCSKHYDRQRAHGSLDDPRPSFEERFWTKVRKNDGDQCWEWLAGRDKDGYGMFSIGPRAIARSHGAHRVSWMLEFGMPPSKFQVLHTCDNPPCVRPDHLFLGTNADNIRDMVAKGRQALGDKNGKRTHPEKIQWGDDHWKRRAKNPEGHAS